PAQRVDVCLLSALAVVLRTRHAVVGVDDRRGPVVTIVEGAGDVPQSVLAGGRPTRRVVGRLAPAQQHWVRARGPRLFADDVAEQVVLQLVRGGAAASAGLLGYPAQVVVGGQPGRHRGGGRTDKDAPRLPPRR